MNMFYLQSVKRTFIVIFQEDHLPQFKYGNYFKASLARKTNRTVIQLTKEVTWTFTEQTSEQVTDGKRGIEIAWYNWFRWTH